MFLLSPAFATGATLAALTVTTTVSLLLNPSLSVTVKVKVWLPSVVGL